MEVSQQTVVIKDNLFPSVYKLVEACFPNACPRDCTDTEHHGDREHYYDSPM